MAGNLERDAQRIARIHATRGEPAATKLLRYVVTLRRLGHHGSHALALRVAALVSANHSVAEYRAKFPKVAKAYEGYRSRINNDIPLSPGASPTQLQEDLNLIQGGETNGNSGVVK